jgi:hypothetical protein
MLKIGVIHKIDFIFSDFQVIIISGTDEWMITVRVNIRTKN